MSRPKSRPRADHQHVADQARQLPGQWVLAGAYNSSSSASHAAGLVRNASDSSMRFYRPAGAFETRTELTDDGADLWVRHTAGQPEGAPRVSSDDQAARDFHESVATGLTEDLDAFSHRLDMLSPRGGNT